MPACSTSTSLCRRTIKLYIKLFREDELAQAIMHDVTGELVQLLELDASKQRLDWLTDARESFRASC